MDDEDELGVNLPGSGLGAGPLSADLAVGAAQYQKNAAAARERQNAIRQQQLLAATEALRARRMGPSMAEQLFAISAAFAQPRRTRGFAGTLANVMPTLGKIEAARREGKDAQTDAMLSLQKQYGDAEIENLGATTADQLALLKLQMQMQKSDRVRGIIDPTTGKVKNPYTGEVIDPMAAGLPAFGTPEFEALPAGGRYRAPDGSMRIKGGGGGVGDGAGTFQR